jgi:trigger factor
MEVSVDNADGLERRMKVQIPSEQVESAVEDKLRRVSRSAQIAGFRPGKVPLKIIRQRYGDQVRQEVVGDLLQSTYPEALGQT